MTRRPTKQTKAVLAGETARDINRDPILLHDPAIPWGDETAVVVGFGMADACAALEARARALKF